MTLLASATRQLIERSMSERNRVSAMFFDREAIRLANISRRMAERFEAGGRLLAFGRGACASDAQHIAVEFVHPVLVGKRALPALDLSSVYRDALSLLVGPGDIAVGFAPPGGDGATEVGLSEATRKGALTLALPGATSDYAVPAPSPDPFVTQELMEITYHTLWETVHVFFEPLPLQADDSAASFLYPFLREERQENEAVTSEVAESIRAKASQVEQLRTKIVSDQSDTVMAAVNAMQARVEDGGTVLCFGNGGSATDAADLAFDLSAPPKGYPPVPALSLASDAATLTAIANDIGGDAVFARQLMAYGRASDVAVAISTSGGSSNIVAALKEARRRGLLTIAMVGYDGGEVARHGLADHVIVVESDQIPRIQEAQASIYHLMVDLLAAFRPGRD